MIIFHEIRWLMILKRDQDRINRLKTLPGLYYGHQILIVCRNRNMTSRRIWLVQFKRWSRFDSYFQNVFNINKSHGHSHEGPLNSNIEEEKLKITPSSWKIVTFNHVFFTCCSRFKNKLQSLMFRKNIFLATCSDTWIYSTPTLKPHFSCTGKMWKWNWLLRNNEMLLHSHSTVEKLFLFLLYNGSELGLKRAKHCPRL